jgi:hypothetical protein
MNLKDLALKYGSDKAEHGYCEFYERTLPKNPKNILEIGVLKGASLRMWHEYFPDAEIYGLDLFENNVSKKWEIESAFDNEYGIGKIKLIMGNQCDWEILEQLRKHDFDIVIDDGSHNSRDQMISFFGLFNGKHYFIEDIHCCDEEFYRQGLPLGVTSKKLFDQHDFRYNAFYDCQSPIVLIQSV